MKLQLQENSIKTSLSPFSKTKNLIEGQKLNDFKMMNYLVNKKSRRKNNKRCKVGEQASKRSYLYKKIVF